MPTTAADFGVEVAERFGLGSVISVEPGGSGANGRIWRLRTAEADVAVKQLFTRQPTEVLEPFARREAAFAEAGRAAGVLAPRDHTDGTGRLAVPTSGGAVRVADWVPGTAVRVDDPGAAEWAGWVMARLTGLGFGTDDDPTVLDPWYTVAPTEEDWLGLSRAARRARMTWADRLAGEVPELLNLADLAGRADRDPVWCHTDVMPQNAVRRVDGRYELIDWDDAGPVDPVFALGRLLVDWGLDPDGRVAERRVHDVVAGYDRGGGVHRPSVLADFGGLVVGTLNFLAGQVTLAVGLAPDEAVDAEITATDLTAEHRRTTAGAQVLRLLEHPLRRTTLEQVLGVLERV